MWITTRQDRAPVEECAHEHRVKNGFAGLGRSVCEKCGHVSVSYLYDMFEEERRQLDVVDRGSALTTN